MMKDEIARQLHVKRKLRIGPKEIGLRIVPVVTGVFVIRNQLSDLRADA